MRKIERVTVGMAVLVGAGIAAGVAAQAQSSAGPLGRSVATPAQAEARLLNASGAEMGRVLLRQTPGHGVILDIRATGLEPGTHAVHIHETGACSPPDFQSAGGHYDPEERAHGPLHANGMHAGDMVNLHVPASGEIRAERLATRVTLESGAAGSLFDDDGSAIVIHAGADDYRSQPSGDAGGRVLCGVVRP